MTRRTMKNAAALTRGDVLQPYDRRSTLEVLGRAQGGAKLRVKALSTGETRLIDNDLAKLRKHYIMPERMRQRSDRHRAGSLARRRRAAFA